MNAEDLQAELDQWLGRLRQVDRVVEPAAHTLLATYRTWQEQKKGAKTVPMYVTKGDPPKDAALLIHAMTCSTLQRLARHRRRYPWLAKDERRFLKTLNESVANPFLPSLDPDRPLAMVEAFEDNLFGALNPLGAAEAFSVLINSGERNAHRGAGFLLLFAMLWSLHRKFPREWERGARLDPSMPTASVTAKCMIVISRLRRIIWNRTGLYRRLREALQKMGERAGKTTQSDLWQFTAQLERLSAAAHALAAVAINGPAFLEFSHQISKLADQIGPNSSTAAIWTEVRQKLNDVLIDLRHTNEEVLGDARSVHDKVLSLIVQKLDSPDPQEWEHLAESCTQIKFQFIRSDRRDKYWKDLATSAKEAREDTENALEALRKGVLACESLREGDTPALETLKRVMEALEEANSTVAQQLEKAVKPNVDWMPIVIREHVAFGSAGNFTQFDPAELLSAISVAERWRADFTEMEARDAINKAIVGERDDGSWMTTQPIYLVNRVHGVWPGTTDVGWLLAIALNERHEITEGDKALFRYLGWLEKNRIDLEGADSKVSGWSSETPEEEVIDLWATCVAINSLLEIRELFEHRLWQLCEKRFLVRQGKDLKELSGVDPVDLGVVHESRLHGRMARMARETSEVHEDDADLKDPPEYALVLHGPPGSSKTAIAEALGREMWGRDKNARFVRITPADFTRGGEGGLDREARFIFDLLSHVRGVTVFFDEIDDLLRLRESGPGGVNFIKLIVPAMLNRLQDLRDAAPQQDICFLLATNFIDNIEPALTRPGRVDAVIPVPYPDAWSREAIFERIVRRSDIGSDVRDLVTGRTGGWPWSTYRKLCERLQKMSPVTVASVEEQIHHLGTEFERADFYYLRPSRWTTISRPLMNEFIHGAFSISKDRNVCEGKVQELTELLARPNEQHLTDLDFTAAFAAEWRRTRPKNGGSR